MRVIILLTLLSFACNAQSVAPSRLSNYDFTEKKITTEDGQEFIAWIVEEEDAKKLFRQVRRLEKIEVDRSDEFLAFTIYSDGDYEYVVIKQKHFKMKFFRITVYSI
jgi:hypothetical protein